MDYLLMTVGLNTQILFLFKEEWLYKKKSLTWLFLLDILLFIASVIVNENGNPDATKIYGALKMPLVSLLIFLILSQFFYLIYKRKPENTFWVFNKKPIQDVVFSLLFWIFGAIVPIFLFL